MDKIMVVNNFSSRLSIAREMAGLTMQELADRTDLSKQAISKFENGLLSPSSSSIIKLAAALKTSQDFFFEETAETDIVLASISHREKRKIILDEFEAIKSDTSNYIFRFLELEKIAGNKQEFKNPISEMSIETRKDAEKAAKQIRKKWNLGNVQIPNVVELLESKGIKVFEVERSENFEGFAAWAGKIPVIVINSAIKEITRVRFTTMHELGHIILQFVDDLGEDTIERLCDAFSGELLFPEEAIIIEFGQKRTKVTIEELKYLKEKYGMSISAIMVSAQQAGVIDFETLSLWRMYYKQWYNEGKDFGRFASVETPQRFNKLLSSCLVEDKISLGKASVLAGVKEGVLKKRFNSLEKHQAN
jgi:Zn-dependent peptidase ImmA (M78 family)/DNA-binding XRE family transcriptional regulator